MSPSSTTHTLRCCVLGEVNCTSSTCVWYYAAIERKNLELVCFAGDCKNVYVCMCVFVAMVT